VDCGFESASDVHLRNATVLHRHPRRLYFSSLLSASKSIASYEEFRYVPEQLDYSRLKQRCRQKYTQETVMKTLVVKGSSLTLTDLTDDVVRVGESPIAHGSFSDVWKGIWMEKTTQRSQAVSLIRFLSFKILGTIVALPTLGCLKIPPSSANLPCATEVSQGRLRILCPR
jgi:hypothetical protein